MTMNINIQLASDLHLEFLQQRWPGVPQRGLRGGAR
jgi:hypothetical protein